MTQFALRKLFYMYLAPFGVTITYSYSWLILEVINRYFLDLEHIDFEILFTGLMTVGAIISIAGIRFANKNKYATLKVIYAFLLILSIGLLLVMKALGDMGSLVA